MSERYLLMISTQHYKALLFLLIWDYDIIPKQFYITLGKYGDLLIVPSFALYRVYRERDEVRNIEKYREKEREKERERERESKIDRQRDKEMEREKEKERAISIQAV